MDNFIKLYDSYSDFCNIIKIIKQENKNLRMRKPNFPEIISEKIVEIIFFDSNLSTKSGDIIINGKRIEIKCFSSIGPISFGPKEKWDIIIFVNAINHPEIEVLICNFSNESKEWNNIKVNKLETYSDQCKQKRRPRIGFKELEKQIKIVSVLKSNILQIFQNNIPKLNIKNYLDEKYGLNIIDLFCGIGGFRVGFEKALKHIGNINYDCIFSNEIDENAIKTYELNFGKVCKDPIENLKDDFIASFKQSDILFAGFPCQSLSIAGEQKGFDDPRGILFFNLVNFIRINKPKIFLLENVKNLKSHENGKTYEIMKNELNNIGYNTFDEILNSCEYGNTPQNRERIYFVGFLKEIYGNIDFSFPKPKVLKKNVTDVLEKEENINQGFYYKNESKIYEILKKEIKDTIYENQRVYQYRRKYVRENKSSLFPTLTANMGTGGHNVPIIKDKNGIRKITPRECLNLQTFPKTYKLPEIANSHLYKQIGNSVTVNVIKRICLEILKRIQIDCGTN
jgi:DNA (cytosine-5)-methyltransferase 1